jgi:hypothetical protein
MAPKRKQNPKVKTNNVTNKKSKMVPVNPRQLILNVLPAVLSNMVLEYLTRDVIWLLSCSGKMFSYDPFYIPMQYHCWDDANKELYQGKLVEYKSEIPQETRANIHKIYWIQRQLLILLVRHIIRFSIYGEAQRSIQVEIIDSEELQRTGCARSRETWLPTIKKENGHTLQSLTAHPTQKSLALLIYFDQCRTTIHIETWDSRTRETKPFTSVRVDIKLEPAPDTILSHSGRLYLVEYGINHIGLKIFDVTTQQWTSHDVKLEKRKLINSHAAPVIWNDHLLLIQGQDFVHDYRETNNTTAININNFSVLEHNSYSARMNHVAAIVNGYLVVLGGCNRILGRQNTLIYDPTKPLHVVPLSYEAPADWEFLASCFVWPMLDLDMSLSPI